MLYWLIGGGLLIYVAGSYYFMYKDLSRNAGPAGLGWFALPLAPLVGPMFIWQGIKDFFRKMGH